MAHVSPIQIVVAFMIAAIVAIILIMTRRQPLDLGKFHEAILAATFTFSKTNRGPENFSFHNEQVSCTYIVRREADGSLEERLLCSLSGKKEQLILVFSSGELATYNEKIPAHSLSTQERKKAEDILREIQKVVRRF